MVLAARTVHSLFLHSGLLQRFTQNIRVRIGNMMTLARKPENIQDLYQYGKAYSGVTSLEFTKGGTGNRHPFSQVALFDPSPHSGTFNIAPKPIEHPGHFQGHGFDTR